MTLFSYPLRVEAHGPEAHAPVEKITRQFVSEDAFDVLGVAPVARRLLLPQGRAVAVLSYSYWKKRFQADPAVLGTNLYSVGRRTKEIGIRTALGARRTEMIWLVLKDADALINGGLVVGLIGALAAMSALRSLFFEIRVTDPW